MSTSRREFLAVAGATTFIALGARAQDKKEQDKKDQKPPDPPKPPLFKISLAEWSYHQAIQKGELDHKDFAKVAKQVHHLEAVELVNTFFKDKAQDVPYLKELKSRADDLGV